jgi:hypothetical protein
MKLQNHRVGGYTEDSVAYNLVWRKQGSQCEIRWFRPGSSQTAQTKDYFRSVITLLYIEGEHSTGHPRVPF